MRRIQVLLTVVAVMVVMLVASALPALAQPPFESVPPSQGDIAENACSHSNFHANPFNEGCAI
jgi:hypothetical protein